MATAQLNRVCGIALIVLSLGALLTVIIGALTQPPQPRADEGALARIFQLSIAAMVPAGFLFLATADWTHPLRSARRLVFPAIVTALAFVILFYLERS